jgi:hypothetical protein
MKKTAFVFAIFLFFTGTVLLLVGFRVVHLASTHYLRYAFAGALALLLAIIGFIWAADKDLKEKLGQLTALINYGILDEKRYQNRRIKSLFIALSVGLIVLVGLLVIVSLIAWLRIPEAAAPIAFTLLVYFILALSFYGWGKLLGILLKIERDHPGNFALPIWLGWAFTLFLFQILHFVFPLTAYVDIPVFVLGVALSIPRLIQARKLQSSQPARLITTRMVLDRLIPAYMLIFLVGASAWIAARSMLTPVNYDTYLYHFNAIRWINIYPIIPGLGNLHGRLAFNQSFFTYTAALNFYPFFNFGRSIANSFLLIMLLVYIFSSLRSTISRPFFLSRHPFHYLPDLLVIPVIIFLALTSNGLASPTPDLASTLLQLLIFLELMHGLADWLDGRRNLDFRAVSLTILSATAITVKLSNLAFCLVMLGFVVVYIGKTSRPWPRAVLRIILPGIVLLLAWAVSGFILSGAPLYPSTLGYIPADWAVPRAAVVDQANSVYSWGRQPDAPPGAILGNWNWLPPWLLQMKSKAVNVLYPLGVCLAFFCIALLLGILFYSKKRLLLRLVEYLIFIPPLLGLLYWFFTAPDLRFANAIFWLLPICSSLVLLALLQRILRSKSFILTGTLVFVITNLVLIGYLCTHYSGFTQISLSGWRPAINFPLTTQKTQSGLVIYEPSGGGNQCGDSPLPCTPTFNPKLRLRNPANLASGFTLSP